MLVLDVLLVQLLERFSLFCAVALVADRALRATEGITELPLEIHAVDRSVAVAASKGRVVRAHLVVEHLVGVGLDPLEGLVGVKAHIDETLLSRRDRIAGREKDGSVQCDQLRARSDGAGAAHSSQ